MLHQLPHSSSKHSRCRSAPGRHGPHGRAVAQGCTAAPCPGAHAAIVACKRRPLAGTGPSRHPSGGGCTRESALSWAAPLRPPRSLARGGAGHAAAAATSTAAYRQAKSSKLLHAWRGPCSPGGSSAPAARRGAPPTRRPRRGAAVSGARRGPLLLRHGSWRQLPSHTPPGGRPPPFLAPLGKDRAFCVKLATAYLQWPVECKRARLWEQCVAAALAMARPARPPRPPPPWCRSGVPHYLPTRLSMVWRFPWRN